MGFSFEQLAPNSKKAQWDWMFYFKQKIRLWAKVKKKERDKERIKTGDDGEEDLKSDLFLCVSGLADFVQQLRVEVLVVGGSLGHRAL